VAWAFAAGRAQASKPGTAIGSATSRHRRPFRSADGAPQRTPGAPRRAHHSAPVASDANAFGTGNARRKKVPNYALSPTASGRPPASVRKRTILTSTSASSRAPFRARVALLGAAGAAVWMCIQLSGCLAKSESPPPTSSQTSPLDIPCDAKRVLETVCQQCHAAPPRNSAPFPLVTYADTQAVASGKPLWSYMIVALQNGVMPLPPVQIAPADRDTLIRWLDAGAPPRSASDMCARPAVDLGDGGIDAEGGAPDSPDDGNAAVESGTLDARAPDALDDGRSSDSFADDGATDAGSEIDACPADDAGPPCN
jgi:hypothetical protein